MITNPFSLFDTWYAEAMVSEPIVPDAMTLATIDPDGQPAARMVLLKGHGPEGFIFYTNLESRKALDLHVNNKVALLFHWKSLRRQIRIEGSVSPVSTNMADAYFATRRRDSQLGAWASDQSRPLASRAIFEARFTEIEARFAGKDVPRPRHWSGYCVTPTRMEFWQDREHRLHERQLFTRHGDGWTEGLLYP